MNKFKVQQDGRTAYEAITKHKCSHLVVGFGEHVHWQQTPQKPVPDKLDGDWRDGIFLGVIWKTNEYIIGTREGVFKCCTVKTRPEETAYDPECIDYVTTTYEDFVLQGAKSEGAKRRFAEPSATPVAAPSIMARGGREWAPRRMYLLPSDFADKGYTPGCPGCTWLQNRLGARRGHTDACRERVEAEISSDSQHADRVKAHKDKIDSYMAAEGEQILKRENGQDSNKKDKIDTEEVKVIEEVMNEVEEPNTEAQVDHDKMDDVEDLEGAPGSSKDIRHASPAKPRPPAEELVSGPSTSTETRVSTPTRRKPTKRKNTDAHLGEPDAKVVIFEQDVVRSNLILPLLLQLQGRTYKKRLVQMQRWNQGLLRQAQNSARYPTSRRK